MASSRVHVPANSSNDVLMLYSALSSGVYLRPAKFVIPHVWSKSIIKTFFPRM